MYYQLFLSTALIFLSFSSACFTADLDLPEVIDGGEVNIRYMGYKSENNYPKVIEYKFIEFKIKNISKEIIYTCGYSKKNNYDDNISLKGNRIDWGISNERIAPGEIKYIAVSFYTSFLDSFSLAGVGLQSDVTIYYRKASSIKIDSIRTKFKCKAINKNELMFLPYNLNKKSLKTDEYGHYKYKISTRGYFYNFTDHKIIVDSAHYHFIGNNFQKLQFNNPDTIINFPYELDTNRRISVFCELKALNPEISMCPVTFYGHFKESGENFIITDTLIYLFDIKNYFDFGAGDKYWFKGWPGLKFNLWLNAGVHNFTDKAWTLVKVDSYADRPQDFSFNFTDTLPIRLDVKERYTFKANPSYTCSDTGTQHVMAYYYFVSDDGDTMVHSLAAEILVQNPAGIQDDIGNDIFEVYPNPAGRNELITIKLKDAIHGDVQIVIYDSQGSIIDKTILNVTVENYNFDYKFKKGIAPGVYWLMITDKGRKSIQPVVIIE